METGNLATIIAAASGGKGGVGKSSLIVNLAGAYASQGKRVAIVDSDTGDAEQGSTGVQSALTFARVRESLMERGEELAAIEVYSVGKDENITRKLKQWQITYDVILIDTPGSASRALKFALPLCDHLLLPINMERDEFLPLRPIIGLIQSVEENLEMVGVSKKIDARILPARILPNWKKDWSDFDHWYAKQAATTLSVCNVQIPYHKSLAQTVSYGKTVHDKSLPERAVFERLIQELLGTKEMRSYRQLGGAC